MKFNLKTTLPIHVLDVSMPILRTSIRNDLRLISKIALTEHDGNLSGRNGEAIREMLGMKSNSWDRILEEGEKAHNLWEGRQLTNKGKACAEDGFVMDHEDGPHRLWVIEAQEPIGLRIIHIEAWSDFEISSGDLGIDHRNGFVQRLRKEGYVHSSILNPKNRCRFKPPTWWVRWMKREPAVQEHSELSSPIHLTCSWKPGQSTPDFSLKGKIYGLKNQAVNIDGKIDIKHPPSKKQMQHLVSNALSTRLTGGQTWDENDNCLRTDIASLASNQEAIERMKMDFELGAIEDQSIGTWTSCTLQGISLRAQNEIAATEWACSIFWNRYDAVHRTQAHTSALIAELSGESAFEGFTLTFDAMMRGLLRARNVPQGARWLFDSAADLNQSIGLEVRL